MQLRIPFLVLLLGSVALAGCVSGPEPQGQVEGAVILDPEDVFAVGASVEQIARDTLQVTWEGPLTVASGFHVTLPEGVVSVEAHRKVASDTGSANLAMYHADTGRIRCQPERYEAYFTPADGEARCTGLTVLDLLPAVWRTNDFRAPSFDVLGNQVSDGVDLATGERLVLTLRSTPLDGEAAKIDLDALSKAVHDERPTETLTIAASADGAELWVEVTRPDMDDQVPTIIVSSPYNADTRNAGLRPQNSTIADWVPRGYAVVSADVRGFGNSGGCVEVWGPNEQQDQVDLVDWVARQAWSDGKIGFYGQSYVGTTPLAAAAHGAEALDAIIIVAPVVNAYNDWHFGGVPNGESTLSPGAAYQGQAANEGDLIEDPLDTARRLGNGFCDPTLTARANDPRAVYDDFYRERDFSIKAGDIKAATLYTQGFYDENVKSAMIPGFFNDITAPKKGLFGDWIHQHPARGDQELYFHAWFDQFLKDIDTGILDTPVVEVKTNIDTLRYDDAWPREGVAATVWGMNLGCCGHELGPAHGEGTESYVSTPSHGLGLAALPTGMVPGEAIVVETEPLETSVYLSGEPKLRLKATIDNMENHFFYAELRDVAPDGTSELITYGLLNAALRNGYESYEPVTPGSTIVGHLPLLPTEYVVQEGHSVRLIMRAADVNDWAAVNPTEPGTVLLDATGDDGTALLLPILEAPGDIVSPLSAGPVIRLG